MVAAPETRYAKSGDLSIAYAAYGDGPDLVVAPGFISHLEVAWEEPGLARFYDRLATFRRVIAFDKRGTGLSDPVPHAPTLEENVEDLRAVMDAVGSERADVVGVSEGGAHYVRVQDRSPSTHQTCGEARRAVTKRPNRYVLFVVSPQVPPDRLALNRRERRCLTALVAVVGCCRLPCGECHRGSRHLVSIR